MQIDLNLNRTIFQMPLKAYIPFYARRGGILLSRVKTAGAADEVDQYVIDTLKIKKRMYGKAL